MADIRPYAYFRDKFVPFDQANLSIASAPVLYGLSIYTVFPVLWDGQKLNMFRVKDHFARLQNSARIVAFEGFLNEWDYGRFVQTMSELLIKNKVREGSLVRVGVFVDDILKGTRMHGLKHSVAAFVYSTPPLLPKSGSRLMVSNWRRNADNSIPSRAKINGSYVNAALMKHEATVNGFDDALALDEQGHVTEGTVANVFLVSKGVLVTPHTSADILEGITRDTILQLASQLGLKHEERAIDRSELYLADEIFLSGSSVQIAPVIDIDHRQIGNGRPGPVTKHLMKAYQQIPMNPANAEWLTAVT